MIFFSQILEMAAPDKVCIDKYTRKILAFMLVYGREYYWSSEREMQLGCSAFVSSWLA